MKGKTILVTGASSGIGYATARKFVAEGGEVIATGRNEAALSELRDECSKLDGNLRVHLADLREFTQVERLVNDTVDSNGGLDVLVNSAGIIANGTIISTSVDEWNRMFEINLHSVFQLIQTCVPSLVKAKGAVVNVSSVAGQRAFPNVLAYCVSKAALDQMTKCVALELAPEGVRVNSVNPGVVVSNLHKRSGMDEEQYEAFLEHSKSTHPIGRVGRPEEIADLIYFLSSPAAGWITGGTYEIDGGRAQTCAR